MSDLVSIKAACQQLGVSVNTLLRLRKDGKFAPDIRIGARRIGFRQADIDQFVEDSSWGWHPQWKHPKAQPAPVILPWQLAPVRYE